MLVASQKRNATSPSRERNVRKKLQEHSDDPNFASSSSTHNDSRTSISTSPVSPGRSFENGPRNASTGSYQSSASPTNGISSSMSRAKSLNSNTNDSPEKLKYDIALCEEEYRHKKYKVESYEVTIQRKQAEKAYTQCLMTAHVFGTPYEALSNNLKEFLRKIEEETEKLVSWANTTRNVLNSSETNIANMKNRLAEMEADTPNFGTTSVAQANSVHNSAGVLYGGICAPAPAPAVQMARLKRPDPRLAKKKFVPAAPAPDALFQWAQKAFSVPVPTTHKVLVRDKCTMQIKKIREVRTRSVSPQGGGCASEQHPWHKILCFLNMSDIGRLDAIAWRRENGPEPPAERYRHYAYEQNGLWSPLLPIFKDHFSDHLSGVQVNDLNNLKWLWQRAPQTRPGATSMQVWKDMCDGDEATIPSAMQLWFVENAIMTPDELAKCIRFGVRGSSRGYEGYESIFNYCARSGNAQMLNMLLDRAWRNGGEELVQYVLIGDVVRKRTPPSNFGLQGHLDEFCDLIGFTPLHFAAIQGQVDSVSIILKHLKELAERGKLVDSKNRVIDFNIPTDILFLGGGSGLGLGPYHGWTPMHLAALAGHAKVVDLMLEKNPAWTEKRTQKTTVPFYKNSRWACIKTGELASDEGTTYIDLSDEFTPYHCAVLGSARREGKKWIYNEGCLKCVESLITAFCDADVDINISDNKSNTALHYACKYNNLAMIERIVSASSNIRCREKPKLDIKNRAGDSTMHIACQEGFLDIVEYLHPKIPIEDQPDEVKNSRRHINYTNLSERDEDGNTPLHVAISHEHVDIVRHLANLRTDKQKAKHGARFDQKNVAKKTPLMLAQELLKDDRYNEDLKEIKKILDNAMNK